MTSDSQLMDSRDVDSTEENENAKEDVAEQWEKGYDLPICLLYTSYILKEKKYNRTDI